MKGRAKGSQWVVENCALLGCSNMVTLLNSIHVPESAVMRLGKDSLNHLHISSTSPAAASGTSTPVNHLLFILSLTWMNLDLASSSNDSNKSICNYSNVQILTVHSSKLAGSSKQLDENQLLLSYQQWQTGIAAPLCCALWHATRSHPRNWLEEYAGETLA